MERAERAGREPDVEIGASVEADEIVVHEAADVAERTAAEPEGDSEVRTERRGLPRPVEPDRTYRRVRISHRLSARLTAPDLGADPDNGPDPDQGAGPA